MFHHSWCPASALCHVRVFLNLLSLLASCLMRHSNGHVAGQTSHGIAAEYQDWSLSQCPGTWTAGSRVIQAVLFVRCHPGTGNTSSEVAACAQNILGIAFGDNDEPPPNVLESIMQCETVKSTCFILIVRKRGLGQVLMCIAGIALNRGNISAQFSCQLSSA